MSTPQPAPYTRESIQKEPAMHLHQLNRSPLPALIPETEDTKATALAAQESGRAEFIARALAEYSGYHDLASEPEHIRQHFAQWGLIAVRGSAFTGNPFRFCALASHAAAQACADLEAHLEHYPAVDLLAPKNAYERQHWSQLAGRAVQTYLDVLGGKTAEAAKDVYAERLKLEMEASHGDARR
jgi:hypothetical protein